MENLSTQDGVWSWRPDPTVARWSCRAPQLKFEKCRTGVDFEIHDYLAEFRHTGLTESSNVIEHDMQIVPPERIRKTKGRLTGELARRFADWAGMPPPEQSCPD